MRRRRAYIIVACVAIAFFIFFFLAPIVFWTNVGSPSGNTGGYVIYQSLGCTVFGYGDTNWVGQSTQYDSLPPSGFHSPCQIVGCGLLEAPAGYCSPVTNTLRHKPMITFESKI
ncbi:MAG: hypothetical protein JRN20_18695 [Nitrososphaerota archaeon]|nr:hypothetical protein [Nitrososphaerota archaeon]